MSRYFPGSVHTGIYGSWILSLISCVAVVCGYTCLMFFFFFCTQTSWILNSPHEWWDSNGINTIIKASLSWWHWWSVWLRSLQSPIRGSQFESHQCHKREKKINTMTPTHVHVLNTIVRLTSSNVNSVVKSLVKVWDDIQLQSHLGRSGSLLSDDKCYSAGPERRTALPNNLWSAL